MPKWGWIALGAIVVALLTGGLPVPASASPGRAAAVSAAGSVAVSHSAVRVRAEPRWRASARVHRRHADSARWRRWAALHRAYRARRHRLQIARAPPAAPSDAIERAESGPEALGAGSDLERPAPSCGLRGLTACRSQRDAEHALVLETRRAMALGVPAAVLRVGFDDWRDRELRPEARPGPTALVAYRIRTAFVEDAIVRRGGRHRGEGAAETGLL